MASDFLEGREDWWNDNPFGFDIERLGDHFIDRANAALGAVSYSLVANGGEHLHIKWLPVFEPFSKQWSELWIAHELWRLGDLESDATTPSALIANQTGKVGRMIESYRWRFAYGDHALSGRKANQGAVQGGLMRKNKLAPRILEAMKVMKAFIDKGESVTDAARFTFKKGYGTSEAANRANWYRYQDRLS